MTTTNEVLATYVAAMAHGGSMENDSAEFFAWLNTIRAQAYDRGVHEREEIPYWEDGPVNPYEEKSWHTQHSALREHFDGWGLTPSTKRSKR